MKGKYEDEHEVYTQKMITTNKNEDEDWIILKCIFLVNIFIMTFLKFNSVPSSSSDDFLKW